VLHEFFGSHTRQLEVHRLQHVFFEDGTKEETGVPQQIGKAAENFENLLPAGGSDQASRYFLV